MKIRSAIFAITLLTLSFAVQAGCGETNTMCHYYKSGQLVSKDHCKITTCASMTTPAFSEWKWHNKEKTVTLSLSKKDSDSGKIQLLLNNRPAYKLPFELIEKTDCYTVINGDEILCADDGAI